MKRKTKEGIMKAGNKQNSELTINILSNHKTLIKSLVTWLYNKYPDFSYNTSTKNNNQLLFLDSPKRQLVIIDISLSIPSDLDLIDFIKNRFSNIRIIAITPFEPGILKNKLGKSQLHSIIPKWKISNKLPAILEIVGRRDNDNK